MGADIRVQAVRSGGVRKGCGEVNWRFSMGGPEEVAVAPKGRILAKEAFLPLARAGNAVHLNQRVGNRKTGKGADSGRVDRTGISRFSVRARNRTDEP